MSKQQVEQAYPNFENYQNINGVKQFGLRTYYAAGCDFEVQLDFWDNQLYQIDLESFREMSDQKFCHAKEALTATYGQPTEIPHISGEKSLMWKTGDTQVLYEERSDLGKVGDRPFGYVSVSYRNRSWEFPEKRL
jgi:hypothetical protein